MRVGDRLLHWHFQGRGIPPTSKPTLPLCGWVCVQTPSVTGATPGTAPQPGSARASLMAQYPSLQGLGGTAPPTFATPGPAPAPAQAPVAAAQITSGPGTATPPLSESGHQPEEERLRSQVGPRSIRCSGWAVGRMTHPGARQGQVNTLWVKLRQEESMRQQALQEASTVWSALEEAELSWCAVTEPTRCHPRPSICN